MIELAKIEIKNFDGIIEARNKIHRLIVDLKIRESVAIRLATLASQVLRTVIAEKKEATTQFSFTKKNGFYSVHVFISCTEDSYSKFKEIDIFRDIQFRMIDEKPYLEFGLRVMDESFVPNESFLENERERLIQQSGAEMLQEIRRKNEELNKALSDLKTSSGMIQTEKMRALGGLTAGVAHELNNPMMGILNFVQYAIKHTEKEDRKYKPLVDAEKEIRRCQSIIDNLLTFSRMKAEGDEEYTPVKLSTLCERIVQLHAYKIRSANVSVVEEFPDDEPNVEIKANKMQQVILNFVTNAIDAMKECDTKELKLRIIPHADKVECYISDTGTGIDEETLDKIFEPFFTTKKTGQGTGLGLSVSQSIIEENNGSLRCESKVGEGTCFILTLPIKQKSDKKNEDQEDE